jgi:hypothetical protein
MAGKRREKGKETGTHVWMSCQSSRQLTNKKKHKQMIKMNQRVSRDNQRGLRHQRMWVSGLRERERSRARARSVCVCV